MTGTEPKLKKGDASSTGYSPRVSAKTWHLLGIFTEFHPFRATPVNNPSPDRNFSTGVASGTIRGYLDTLL
jgi:hypothetical protein